MRLGVIRRDAEDLLELAHCLVGVEVSEGTVDEDYLSGTLLCLAFLQELDGMGLTHMGQADAVGLAGEGVTVHHCLAQATVLVVALHEVAAAVLDVSVEIVAIRSEEHGTEGGMMYQIAEVLHVMLHNEGCHAEITKAEGGILAYRVHTGHSLCYVIVGRNLYPCLQITLGILGMILMGVRYKATNHLARLVADTLPYLRERYASLNQQDFSRC